MCGPMLARGTTPCRVSSRHTSALTGTSSVVFAMSIVLRVLKSKIEMRLSMPPWILCRYCDSGISFVTLTDASLGGIGAFKARDNSTAKGPARYVPWRLYIKVG